MPITIEMHKGTIVCEPHQGNVRVGPKGSVTWQIAGHGLQFRLTFYSQPFDGMPPRPSDWPFEGEPPATAPSTAWVTTFTAAAGNDGVFKYVIEVKDSAGHIVRLDPMIIIRN